MLSRNQPQKATLLRRKLPSPAKRLLKPLEKIFRKDLIDKLRTKFTDLDESCDTNQLDKFAEKAKFKAVLIFFNNSCYRVC